jgi:hypothetical protein
MKNTDSFGQLSAAETKLQQACMQGKWAHVNNKIPNSRTNENTVRGEFIRFLALGGDLQSPVHHRGVHVEGAWIEGKIDLMNAIVNCSIILRNCFLTDQPSFLHANISGLLSLRGSCTPGIDARGLKIRNSITLDNGFKSLDSILLFGAEIQGNLDLDGAQINHGNSEYALNADDIIIEKNCLMGPSFFANGEIRLIGAKIGGDLDFKNGQLVSRFNSSENHALSCDGINVNGSVFFTDNFLSKGKIGFPAAQINKGLCITTKNPIKCLDLSNCSVNFLTDDLNSWGENIKLDGFTYKSIRNSDTTNSMRISWLKKQSPLDYGLRDQKHLFSPQPWLQIIIVLRSMGHTREANRMAIEYQKHLWKIKKISGLFKRPLHYLYGVFSGYGYRSHRLIIALIITWLSFGMLYSYAAINGVFSPSNPLVFENKEYDKCRPVDKNGVFDIEKSRKKTATSNWYYCTELKGEYTTFSPFAYSLDVALPLIDLQQEKDWGPFINTPESTFLGEITHFSLNHLVRIAVWLEILLGWIFSLLLVAQLSGLTRNSID